MPHDPATLTSRTLWQWWDRDRGGWTKALRFHSYLPLVKFSMSAGLNWEDDPQDGHYWSGRCWIVEEHPRACAFWGEKGEMGLGQGSPLFTSELDPGWMNWRTNRIALAKGREHLEEHLLCPEGRAFYADLLCADLIAGKDDFSEWKHREALWELWSESLSSTKTGYKGELHERKSALSVTPYIEATFEERRVYNALVEAGLTAHEAVEAAIFQGFKAEDSTEERVMIIL